MLVGSTWSIRFVRESWIPGGTERLAASGCEPGKHVGFEAEVGDQMADGGKVLAVMNVTRIRLSSDR
jgi:hypothetical protein